MAIPGICQIATQRCWFTGNDARFLGRVTMDLMMIDVSQIDAQVGDEVVLMGRQGDDEVSAVELAERAGDDLVGDHYTNWGRVSASSCE